MAKYFGLLAFAIFAIAALLYRQLSPPNETGAAPTEQQSREAAPSPTAASNFDFYVLSLSWSPSFCASAGSNQSQQCGATKSFGFVVHGLWPQHFRGYPEFCSTAEPSRVPDQLGRSMFDIMPSMGLIGHQWRKHGSCSGLSQKDYFALTRKAYQAVTIPAEFARVSASKTISPDSVEQAFIRANHSLKADQIAVTCADGMIEEVRICMKPDLTFQSCPEVNQKSCRAKSAKLPPQ